MRKVLLSLLLLFSINVFADDIKIPAINMSLMTPPPKPLYLNTPRSFMNEEDIAVWDTITSMIRDTPVKDITFYVQGVGGSVMVGVDLIRAIQDSIGSGHNISMDVIGPSYSMHAFLTCSTKNVHLRDGASLMFHTPSYTKSYLYGLISFSEKFPDASQNADNEYLYNLCKTNGALTNTDIQHLKQGYEVTKSRYGNTIRTVVAIDPDGSRAAYEGICTLLFTVFLGLLIVALTKRV